MKDKEDIYTSCDNDIVVLNWSLKYCNIKQNCYLIHQWKHGVQTSYKRSLRGHVVNG